MSANSESSNSSGAPASPGANADQRYFRAIEDAFIRLRGAPLLLSPADWRQAQIWRKEGIPLEIVVGALEEVFRKRQERAAKGSVSSLRYCKRAVEAAWADVKELLLAEPRDAAPPLAVAARLQALAAVLPQEPLWDGLRTKILTLSVAGDDKPDEAAVEADLAALDEEALRLAETSLQEGARRRLESSLQASLANLRHLLPEAEVEKARARLRRGYLREAVALPLLSLFAPEVERALEEAEEVPDL